MIQGQFGRLAALLVLVAPAASGASASLAVIPPYFEKNQGQVDRPVRFLMRTPASLCLLKAGEVEWRFAGAPSAPLRMVFAGAHLTSPPLGLDPLAGTTNYLLGSRPRHWTTGVPGFRRVRYRDVYPGVSVDFYESGAGLEYDFLLAPGASLAPVRLRFSGAGNLRVLPNGDLAIRSAGGEMRHQAPRAYQIIAGARRPVPAKFHLLPAGDVALSVDTHDPRAALVVDPLVSYHKDLEANATTAIQAIHVDPQGYLYVVGNTIATDLAATAGALPHVAPATCNTNPATGQSYPCQQMFLAKLLPDGSDFVYLTYLGGSGANLATSLAVDAAGTAWVAGSTSSRDFPVTEKAVQTAWKEGQCSTSGLGFTSSFPCNDGFALAVNPAGNALAYSTFLGGSRNDVVYGIGIDAQGDPWITGGTTSPDFPVAGLLFQRGLSGSQDAFVAHMDPRAGKLLASWYLGGSGTDYAARLALDSAGNVYIAGSTGSADFPVSNGALQPEYGGGTDLFLVKLLPDSSMPVYATYFGGENGEMLNDLAVDAAGNAYLAGAVSEMPISLSEGIVWISNPHGLLAKIDPHGAATLYNNQVLDTVSSIAVDSQGRVTALGRKIFNAPFTADAISTCNTTGSFLLRLEADGKTVRYGSSAWGNEVAIAASDAVYLAGATSMEKQDFSRNPSMAATCVLGATEFMASAVAPGEIVSIYGRSLGPAEGVAASYDVSGRLPFRLGEVSVSFDGTVAPLLYVQANQINAVVPFAAAGRRSSSVVVTYNGNSTSATVSMADASNIIMQANGAIAAINEDGSINSKDYPARKGSIVTIFSSGGGQTNPPSVDGQIATAPALLVLPVKVLIGSASPVPAEVLYAGAAPGLLAGTVQVNFRVPANLPDSPVSLGYPNQNVALIIGGDQTSYSTSGAIFVE